MSNRTQRIALITGSVAMVVFMALLFWNFRARPVANVNMSAEEARYILRIASKERWKLMRLAITRREFKLLWQVISSHPDAVSVSILPPRDEAIVSCSGGFSSHVTLVFLFKPEGTNFWRFSRWMVIDQPPRQARN